MMKESKGFFQSKIILLAIIGLLFQLVGPLVGHEYDPATGQVEEDIVTVIFSGGDWVPIVLNVLIIIARWLFTDKKISGAIVPGAGLLSLLLIVSAGSVMGMATSTKYDHNGYSATVIKIKSQEQDYTFTALNRAQSGAYIQKAYAFTPAVIPVIKLNAIIIPFRRARDCLQLGRDIGQG